MGRSGMGTGPGLGEGMDDGVSAKGDFPSCAGPAGGGTGTPKRAMRSPVTQATVKAATATAGGWSLPGGRSLWVFMPLR